MEYAGILADSIEGAAVAAVAPLRRLAVRIKEVHLNGEFQGWSFVCRTNVPWSVLEGMQSGNYERIRDELAKILISWDFVDEEGRPMPKPSPESISALPFDLMTAVLEGATEAIMALTKRGTAGNR